MGKERTEDVGDRGVEGENGEVGELKRTGGGRWRVPLVVVRQVDDVCQSSGAIEGLERGLFGQRASPVRRTLKHTFHRGLTQIRWLERVDLGDLKIPDVLRRPQHCLNVQTDPAIREPNVSKHELPSRSTYFVLQDEERAQLRRVLERDKVPQLGLSVLTPGATDERGDVKEVGPLCRAEMRGTESESVAN